MKSTQKICVFALCLMAAQTLQAGGLLTNSNQSASFLRNPARDAVIDIDGVYTNPAGVAFMSPGFHIGFTIQHPEQERNVTTSFLPLAQNVNYLGQSERLYHGQASAPVVPSFQAAYVMKHWTVSASFAFSGGGGKCEFDDGIGSIESVYSLLPSAAQQYGIPAQGYSLDSYMKGRQYYYGVQVGASYKFNDHVSVFGGLRAIIGSASYTGYVRNVTLYADAANRVALPSAYTPYVSGIFQAMGDPTGTGEIAMTTDQHCVGWMPVIGVDWRINEHWNIAAKYEFRTKMALKNDTKEMNDFARSQSMLAKFDETQTKTVRDDVPGTLTLGVQYSPIDKVRLNAGFHWYDDCRATKYNHEEDKIEHGTREFLAGAEWDVVKYLTVSAGWQNTHYSLSPEYMQDMSFNCSSNMLAVGVRVNVNEKVNIDLGYMRNFYQSKDVTTDNYMNSGHAKTDHYNRKNQVVAVGVNVNF